VSENDNCHCAGTTKVVIKVMGMVTLNNASDYRANRLWLGLGVR